ncbi:putative RNA-directed DNA polymerase, eukaryota, reverse transcriptase zinc-binding domain protein [Tanacetum coccineum]|uniref:RNA-directed DNA polymerase, eukaryota, reverse transcriptase zinc-binding domain protein n=1 Tax=Tanacetum coccineum TaxID=301880 RepID=A0ABQ5CKR4_9ASTR
MVNEIINWVSRRRSKLMIFKVDFEKAFDTLNWNFLDDIMRQMGFGQVWRKWIKGCLNSSYTSVLVNGSPTQEFKVGKGVRQGDPLSPFLFLIVAEALSVAIEEAIEGGTFNGVRVGNDPLIVSHFQFADDVIFLGEWSYMNLKNLLRILRCFHIGSGLKVYLSKSALYGVGVSRNEVDWMASTLKCTPGSLPFNYLGLPVGDNMSISCHWSPIIEKVQKRLSSWKARCLSICGRLTLVKSVLGGSAEDRNISWVAWKQIMADRFMGGLGIGSLLASNLSLLGKWWWRFHTEPDALWRQVISSIHGSCARLNSNRDSIKGSGSSTRMWKDVWFGSQSLDQIYPRLFSLALDKDCSVQQWVSATSENRDLWRRDLFLGREMEDLENFDSVIMGLSLQDGVDGWTWSLDTSGSFKVSILRSCIDSLDLSRSDPVTIWNELIPKKVNIFFWRLTRNRLPTKTNLVDKGIDLHTVLCSFCDDYCESSDHIFIECKMVKPI